MAVKSFPDISPDANPNFTLESNTSSFESTLNKNVQHMELPGARWRGSVAFSNRTKQEANKIKAFMTSLGGQVGRFYLTPFDAYQSGTMSGAGVVDGAVAFGASVISTNGWEGGQSKLFEAGDYLEVNGELKMVTEDVVGIDYIEYTGTNYMPSPFDPSQWFGATIDPDLAYTSVTESNPSGESFVGEFECIAVSSATTFARGDYAAFLAGDDLYTSVVAGKNQYQYIRFLLQDSIAGIISDFRYKIDTNTIGLNTGGATLKRTDLNQDWVLLEVKFTAGADGSFRGSLWGDDFSGTMPMGDKIKLQAAYFGKADDWPAQLLATADIPIAPPLRKPLTGGESITVTEPKGKFYLGSNDQSWDINVNGVQSMGFDFIEDVN
jgi:hypothetical protein